MHENTKNYLGWAIMVGILVIAYSVFAYVGAYSRSIQPSSFRSFSVSGDGKAVAVPDIAQFNFSVVTEGGKDIAKLEQDNNQKINSAIKFIKDKGIATADIKTESYNLTPRYEYSNCGGYPAASTKPCPPPAIAGYTINQTVMVKIRADKFAVIGDVLSGVISAGANNVSQLAFTVDDPTALENEARAIAINKAQTKARAIAKAGGFGLGRLLAIEEGGLPPMFKAFNRADSVAGAPMEGPTPATIEAGSQEIGVSVTLRYEIN